MRMRMSKFMRISADADPDAELRYTSTIYLPRVLNSIYLPIVLNSIYLRRVLNIIYLPRVLNIIYLPRVLNTIYIFSPILHRVPHLCDELTLLCPNSVSNWFWYTTKIGTNININSYRLATHWSGAHGFFFMIPSYFKIEILAKRANISICQYFNRVSYLKSINSPCEPINLESNPFLTVGSRDWTLSVLQLLDHINFANQNKLSYC